MQNFFNKRMTENVVRSENHNPYQPYSNIATTVMVPASFLHNKSFPAVGLNVRQIDTSLQRQRRQTLGSMPYYKPIIPQEETSRGGGHRHSFDIPSCHRSKPLLQETFSDREGGKYTEIFPSHQIRSKPSLNEQEEKDIDYSLNANNKNIINLNLYNEGGVATKGTTTSAVYQASCCTEYQHSCYELECLSSSPSSSFFMDEKDNIFRDFAKDTAINNTSPSFLQTSNSKIFPVETVVNRQSTIPSNSDSIPPSPSVTSPIPSFFTSSSDTESPRYQHERCDEKQSLFQTPPASPINTTSLSPPPHVIITSPKSPAISPSYYNPSNVILNKGNGVLCLPSSHSSSRPSHNSSSSSISSLTPPNYNNPFLLQVSNKLAVTSAAPSMSHYSCNNNSTVYQRYQQQTQQQRAPPHDSNSATASDPWLTMDARTNLGAPFVEPSSSGARNNISYFSENFNTSSPLTLREAEVSIFNSSRLTPTAWSGQAANGHIRQQQLHGTQHYSHPSDNFSVDTQRKVLLDSPRTNSPKTQSAGASGPTTLLRTTLTRPGLHRDRWSPNISKVMNTAGTLLDTSKMTTISRRPSGNTTAASITDLGSVLEPSPTLSADNYKNIYYSRMTEPENLKTDSNRAMISSTLAWSPSDASGETTSGEHKESAFTPLLRRHRHRTIGSCSQLQSSSCLFDEKLQRPHQRLHPLSPPHTDARSTMPLASKNNSLIYTPPFQPSLFETSYTYPFIDNTSPVKPEINRQHSHDDVKLQRRPSLLHLHRSSSSERLRGNLHCHYHDQNIDRRLALARHSFANTATSRKPPQDSTAYCGTYNTDDIELLENEIRCAELSQLSMSRNQAHNTSWISSLLSTFLRSRRDQTDKPQDNLTKKQNSPQQWSRSDVRRSTAVELRQRRKCYSPATFTFKNNYATEAVHQTSFKDFTYPDRPPSAPAYQLSSFYQNNEMNSNVTEQSYALEHTIRYNSPMSAVSASSHQPAAQHTMPITLTSPQFVSTTSTPGQTCLFTPAPVCTCNNNDLRDGSNGFNHKNSASRQPPQYNDACYNCGGTRPTQNTGEYYNTVVNKNNTNTVAKNLISLHAAAVKSMCPNGSNEESLRSPFKEDDLFYSSLLHTNTGFTPANNASAFTKNPLSGDIQQTSYCSSTSHQNSNGACNLQGCPSTSDMSRPSYVSCEEWTTNLQGNDNNMNISNTATTGTTNSVQKVIKQPYESSEPSNYKNLPINSTEPTAVVAHTGAPVIDQTTFPCCFIPRSSSCEPAQQYYRTMSRDLRTYNSWEPKSGAQLIPEESQQFYMLNRLSCELLSPQENNFHKAIKDGQQQPELLSVPVVTPLPLSQQHQQQQYQERPQQQRQSSSSMFFEGTLSLLGNLFTRCKNTPSATTNESSTTNHNNGNTDYIPNYANDEPTKDYYNSSLNGSSYSQHGRLDSREGVNFRNLSQEDDFNQSCKSTFSTVPANKKQRYSISSTIKRRRSNSWLSSASSDTPQELCCGNFSKNSTHLEGKLPNPLRNSPQLKFYSLTVHDTGGLDIEIASRTSGNTVIGSLTGYQWQYNADGERGRCLPSLMATHRNRLAGAVKDSHSKNIPISTTNATVNFNSTTNATVTAFVAGEQQKRAKTYRFRQTTLRFRKPSCLRKALARDESLAYNTTNRHSTKAPFTPHPSTLAGPPQKFYYFGEVKRNKRHGWGTLVNDKRILYEGQWRHGRCFGWYIIHHEFFVEIGRQTLTSRSNVIIAGTKDMTVVPQYFPYKRRQQHRGCKFILPQTLRLRHNRKSTSIDFTNFLLDPTLHSPSKKQKETLWETTSLGITQGRHRTTPSLSFSPYLDGSAQHVAAPFVEHRYAYYNHRYLLNNAISSRDDTAIDNETTDIDKRTSVRHPFHCGNRNKVKGSKPNSVMLPVLNKSTTNKTVFVDTNRKSYYHSNNELKREKQCQAELTPTSEPCSALPLLDNNIQQHNSFTHIGFQTSDKTNANATSTTVTASESRRAVTWGKVLSLPGEQYGSEEKLESSNGNIDSHEHANSESCNKNSRSEKRALDKKSLTSRTTGTTTTTSLPCSDYHTTLRLTSMGTEYDTVNLSDHIAGSAISFRQFRTVSDIDTFSTNTKSSLSFHHERISLPGRLEASTPTKEENLKGEEEAKEEVTTQQKSKFFKCPSQVITPPHSISRRRNRLLSANNVLLPWTPSSPKRKLIIFTPSESSSRCRRTLSTEPCSRCYDIYSDAPTSVSSARKRQTSKDQQGLYHRNLECTRGENADDEDEDDDDDDDDDSATATLSASNLFASNLNNDENDQQQKRGFIKWNYSQRSASCSPSARYSTRSKSLSPFILHNSREQLKLSSKRNNNILYTPNSSLQDNSSHSKSSFVAINKDVYSFLPPEQNHAPNNKNNVTSACQSSPSSMYSTHQEATETPILRRGASFPEATIGKSWETLCRHFRLKRKKPLLPQDSTVQRKRIDSCGSNPSEPLMTTSALPSSILDTSLSPSSSASSSCNTFNYDSPSLLYSSCYKTILNTTPGWLRAANCVWWTTNQLALFFEMIGLHDEATFTRRHQLSGVDIPHLTETRMKDDLGMKGNHISMRHRRRFLTSVLRYLWSCCEKTDILLPPSYRKLFLSSSKYNNINNSRVSLGKLIGSGGYADVYHAQVNGQAVACKIFGFKKGDITKHNGVTAKNTEIIKSNIPDNNSTDIPISTLPLININSANVQIKKNKKNELLIKSDAEYKQAILSSAIKNDEKTLSNSYIAPVVTTTPSSTTLSHLSHRACIYRKGVRMLRQGQYNKKKVFSLRFCCDGDKHNYYPKFLKATHVEDSKKNYNCNDHYKSSLFYNQTTDKVIENKGEPKTDISAFLPFSENESKECTNNNMYDDRCEYSRYCNGSRVPNNLISPYTTKQTQNWDEHDSNDPLKKYNTDSSSSTTTINQQTSLDIHTRTNHSPNFSPKVDHENSSSLLPAFPSKTTKLFSGFITNSKKNESCNTSVEMHDNQTDSKALLSSLLSHINDTKCFLPLSLKNQQIQTIQQSFLKPNKQNLKKDAIIFSFYTSHITRRYHMNCTLNENIFFLFSKNRKYIGHPNYFFCTKRVKKDRFWKPVSFVFRHRKYVKKKLNNNNQQQQSWLINTSSNFLSNTYNQLQNQHDGDFEKKPIDLNRYRLHLYQHVSTARKHRDYEAKILSLLPRHPFVLKFLGNVEMHSAPGFLVEVCNRGSLDGLIYPPSDRRQNAQWKKLSRRSVVFLFEELALAMGYVHKRSIVHRDLKLSNILVDEKGDIRISDFGIATPFSPEDNPAVLAIYGNVYYAAPEVLRGEGFYCQSDVWSFGVAFWEALTGKLAFGDDPAGLVFTKLASFSLTLPIPPDVPSALQDLLKRVLDLDWKKRPSFDVISRELRKLRGQTEAIVVNEVESFFGF